MTLRIWPLRVESIMLALSLPRAPLQVAIGSSVRAKFTDQPCIKTCVPAEQADIVFLPYNYLIDSVVRSAMNISVQGAVLIFDEAHNLEDCCRCAPAYQLTP